MPSLRCIRSIWCVIALILLFEASFFILASLEDDISDCDALSSEKTSLYSRISDYRKETRILRIMIQRSEFSIKESPRTYIFIFPTTLMSGEWVRVSGVVIPGLKDTKIKLIYINPKGEVIVRYAMTSGGGKFTDLFYPEEIGRWTVFASWEVSGTEVRSEAMWFEVRRLTLYFYGLLISLISLIIIGLYASFALFI